MPQPGSATLWTLRLFFCALTCIPAVATAQETGTVTGTVTRSGEGLCAVQRDGDGAKHGAERRHRYRRTLHAPPGSSGSSDHHLPLAGLPSSGGANHRRAAGDGNGQRSAGAGSHSSNRAGRLRGIEGSRANRRGLGRHLRGRAPDLTEYLYYRPGSARTAGGSRRGRGSEWRQRFQCQRPRIQLFAEPQGSGASGWARSIDCLSGRARVERNGSAPRGSRAAGDASWARLGTVRRQCVQRCHQYHHA